jgi:chromosomal replication initiation ATPase DnaA
MGHLVAKWCPGKRAAVQGTAEVVLAMPDSVERIVRIVAQRFQIDIPTMLGGHDRKSIEARRSAMRLVFAEGVVAGRAPNYNDVARWFGRSNTTVLVACGRVKTGRPERRKVA